MRVSNRSVNRDNTINNGSERLWVPALTLLCIAGFLYNTVMAFKYFSIERRMEEKYDNAFNATTNSSLCEGGSLEHYTHHNGQDECLTYQPCHHYCVNFWDALINFNGAVCGALFALFLGACFLKTLVKGCEEGTIYFRCVTFGSLNDDLENPLIEGAGGETTWLNCTRRFREYQRQFETTHENTPYNTDGRSSITQDEIKDLENPLVVEDGTVYESEEIKECFKLKDTSPITGLPIGNRLTPYNPNQQSADSQEQIVPAPSALSSSIPFFSHIGSAHKNQGQGNAFMI